MFEVTPSKYYKLANEEILSANGKIPLVSNSSANNGVMGFSSLPGKNRGNAITCSDTTLGCDTMFYQEKDFIGYSHIQYFKPKFTPFNKYIAHFIITMCKLATTTKKYDYGNKFNREAINNTKIQLPTKNDVPDFDFMEEYIKEIEAYLNVTGLNSQELSPEEKDAVLTQDQQQWGS